MCGINCILHFDERPAEIEALKRMNSRMIHRGPDDEGYYVDKNLGLSIRRLSIIDIHGGHQPICDENERYWVVLNGEIYNYLELKDELEGKGHAFKTNSDTEVIVHLYEDIKEGCLEKLNGIFAFAIWDTRDRELFVARDRLGVKPLFYFFDGSSFCCSSELKSLLTLDFKKEIDHGSYLSYFFLLYVPYPNSIMSNVKKLEPATYLKINQNGNITKKVYWKIEDFNSYDKVNIIQFKEELLLLLTDAVKIQMRSDVPVGIFLSGGIDSSCIVALLTQINKNNSVKTFSMGYEGANVDERQYAKQVSGLYNTEHSEIYLSTQDIQENIERIVSYMDEPIGDSAALPTFLLAEMARAYGVKVILNGAGGDEIFGGYTRYIKNGLQDHVKIKMRPLINIACYLLKYPTSPITASRFGNQLMNYLCLVNNGFTPLIRFIRDGTSLTTLQSWIFNNLKETYKPLSHLHIMDRQMFFDLKTYLVDDLLFLLDKMTMAVSIEGRVPFLDHRIVEFMFRIPARIKMENNNLKGLVKEAMKGLLPDEIINRKKMGFGGPVSFWANNNFFKRLNIFDGNISPLTSEIFRIDAIRDYIRVGKFKPAVAQFLYSLIIFEIWYKDIFESTR